MPQPIDPSRHPVADPRARQPAVPHRSGWGAMLADAARGWVDDRAPTMGAALSYYTVFSLAPLLLIVVAVAGLVFGDEAARGEIFGQIRGLVGDDGARTVEELLQRVDKPAQGVLSTLFGIALMLFGATTVFAELQESLDRIWRAPAAKISGVWGLLRARVFSFGLILGVGFLLIVSQMLGAAVAALQTWWAGWFGSAQTLLAFVNAFVGFVLTVALFAMIYKLIPRVKIAWSDVWVGATATALLFTIGRLAIGEYIGRSGVASGFGAAGSLVVLLVWVYYSAQIFLFGAEFTWVWAHARGSRRDLPPPAQTG